MSGSTLDIATEGLLQDAESAGSCKPVVVVRNSPAFVEVNGAESPIRVAASGAAVKVAANAQQRVAAVVSQKLAVVKEPQTDITVAGMACVGGTAPGGTDDSILFTPSRENGESMALYAGQIVCAVSGKWRKASSVAGRHNAVGMILDETLAQNAAGQAQTTGLITLTLAQWDLVTDTVGGLVPESPYFLGPYGRISTAPDMNSDVIVRVGYAVSSTQFSIDIDTPVFL